MLTHLIFKRHKGQKRQVNTKICLKPKPRERRTKDNISDPPIEEVGYCCKPPGGAAHNSRRNPGNEEMCGLALFKLIGVGMTSLATEG